VPAAAPNAIAADPDGPYIVHVSDARPGYTMIVSGGGFDPKTVQVVIHIPGTLVSQREELPKIVAELANTYDRNEYGGRSLSLRRKTVPCTQPEACMDSRQRVHRGTIAGQPDEHVGHGELYRRAQPGRTAPAAVSFGRSTVGSGTTTI